MSTSTRRPLKGTLKDVFLWRRKKLSLFVLLSATLSWVLFEVFEYTLATVAAWAAMVVVAYAFLYSNMAALFGKEIVVPKIEIPEQTIVEIAILFNKQIEELVTWMAQKIIVERDWRVFLGSLAALWVGSIVGSWFNLLTLLYIGILLSFSFPVFYVTYEQKIHKCLEHVRAVTKRWYRKIDEKCVCKVKTILTKKQKKTD